MASIDEFPRVRHACAELADELREWIYTSGGYEREPTAQDLHVMQQLLTRLDGVCQWLREETA